MTLDEAIKHTEEVAYQKDLESGFDTDNERYAMTDKERMDCKGCGEQHRQLAEWLKELKQLRKQTRWVPVTEDAPPKGTICLWCNKQGSVFTSAITYSSERNSYVGKHGYFSNGLENYGDIVAWKPLPEAYKEN